MHVPIVILLGHETYAKTVSIVWFGIHNGHRSGGCSSIGTVRHQSIRPRIGRKETKKKRAKKEPR